MPRELWDCPIEACCASVRVPISRSGDYATRSSCVPRWECIGRRRSCSGVELKHDRDTQRNRVGIALADHFVAGVEHPLVFEAQIVDFEKVEAGPDTGEQVHVGLGARWPAPAA